MLETISPTFQVGKWAERRVGLQLPSVESWTRFAVGLVVRVDATRPGAQELTCDIAGRPVRALLYTDLMPPASPGDKLILNTAALDANLGTGGQALAVSPLPPADDAAPLPIVDGGFLVKARYTPLQAVVRGVDEQTSPHHETLAEADQLDGMPVVTADLHSALPAIVAGILADRPDLRIVYIMSDGAALPLAYSRTVAQLKAAGALAATITAGQAFGGDFEATTVHSALLAARLVVEADIAVVIQGPGNLGTGTRWGFSGVAVGEAVNAAGVLGGQPVGALRVSGADARARHRGLSHHSITAYGQVAQHPCLLPIPTPPTQLTRSRANQSQIDEIRQEQLAHGQAGQGQATRGQAGQGQAAHAQAGQGQATHAQAGQGQANPTNVTGGEPSQGQLWQGEATDLAELVAGIVRDLAPIVEPKGRHRAVMVATDGLMDALRASPVPLSTMGRTLDQDPAAFITSAAAGRQAATLT
ncbi:MAG: DUF3866 family protein [Bifidobacteriaceae bacterium]|jgi:hypothetical protein|nr:DUF3866 family protein [Bifidobacteriaceae bacterium]